MSANRLRVAGCAIAAVPAVGLFVSGVRLEIPLIVLLGIVAMLFLIPTLFFKRTYRVSGRMAAAFLGVNAPIAAFVLLTPFQQPWSARSGDVIHDDEMRRVPLVHLFGGRDQLGSSEQFTTLDTIAGVSLVVAIVWSLGLYVAVFRVNKRTRGAVA